MRVVTELAFTSKCVGLNLFEYCELFGFGL